MSKGNVILGDSSGKLGDIVLYRAAGSQIARLRIRHPKNPRSTRQMVQRVFHATCLKAYSILKDICNHSFEGKQGKRENFGEFMKLNRGRMADKLQGYVSGWEKLPGYVQKNTISMLFNNFIISDGTLPKVDYYYASGVMILRAFRRNDYDFTYQDLTNALEAKKGDEITVVQLKCDRNTGIIDYMKKARFILEPSNGDMNEKFVDEITQEIILPNPRNEGNIKIEPNIGGMRLKMGLNSECGAVILSRYEDDVWKRSFADLLVRGNIANPSTLGDALKSWWQTPKKGKYLNQAERQLNIN